MGFRVKSLSGLRFRGLGFIGFRGFGVYRVYEDSIAVSSHRYIDLDPTDQATPNRSRNNAIFCFQLRNYPVKFAFKLLKMKSRLRAALEAQPSPPPNLDPHAIFEGMCFDDVWADARMPECLKYLKGNTALSIPSAWRALLPEAL